MLAEQEEELGAKSGEKVDLTFFCMASSVIARHCVSTHPLFYDIRTEVWT